MIWKPIHVFFAAWILMSFNNRQICNPPFYSKPVRYFSSSHYLGFPVCCFAVFLWNVLSSPSLFLFDLYFLFVEVISLSEFVSTGFSFLLQPLIRFDAYSFRVRWPSRIGVGHFGSLNSGMTWIQWRLAPIKLFNALAILNRLTVTIQLESVSNR